MSMIFVNVDWRNEPQSSLTEYYRHVGRQIASLPPTQHLAELVAMMRVFQAQGVDVAGMVDCLAEALMD